MKFIKLFGFARSFLSEILYAFSSLGKITLFLTARFYKLTGFYA
jgi:hypothetical protein